VRLGHGRWREDVALVAAGALPEAERAAVEAHAASCPECAEDLRALRVSLDLVAGDGVRGAELPIPLAALVTRVQAELDARLAARSPHRPLRWLVAAAGIVAVAGVAMMMASAGGPARTPSAAVSPAPADPPQMTADHGALRRMERALAREQAARYLSDAQDVLVTVAAQGRPCHRDHDRVDVEDEARRSRELLARRALVLDPQDPGVAPAAPVLDDVEAVLRDVASLEGCARARDVEALHRDIERRRLLMKIELMARELAG
jgi:hypothetical protein